MRPNLITRLKEEWNNLDPVDPLRGLIADAIEALAEQPAISAGPITPAMMQGPTPEQKAQMVEVMSKWAKRWQAQIKTNGKNVHLGYYDTPELAHQAYLSAKANHHFVLEKNQ